jgi:hypothetical protein
MEVVSMENYLNVTDVHFPIIIIQKGFALVSLDEKRLVESRASALRQKWHEGLKFVDADLKLYQVIRAEKVRGIGPLWGYNIFLNQKIEIKLLQKESAYEISLDSLKSLIMGSKKAMEMWRTRDDYQVLISKIDNANSFESLAKIIS